MEILTSITSMESKYIIESTRFQRLLYVMSASRIFLIHLLLRKPMNRTQMNYNSRLLSALSTHFMGVKLKQSGIPVHVNSVHPGFLKKPTWKTALFNFGPIKKFMDKVLTVSLTVSVFCYELLVFTCLVLTCSVWVAYLIEPTFNL